jgi:hypothetical protein
VTTQVAEPETSGLWHAALFHRGTADFEVHEALVNIALAGAPVRMLCPYDVGLPRDVISCAEATHPVISPGGQFQPSPRYQQAIRGHVPAECDRPLPSPPAGARVLACGDDLSATRHVVSVQATEAGLPATRLSDLQIAIGELTANTLVHSPGPGTLTIWATSTEIVCQVSDAGRITDPLAGEAAAWPRGGRRPDGQRLGQPGWAAAASWPSRRAS